MNNLTIPQGRRSADLAAQLARMDRDRMRRYTENLAFYNGEQWQQRATRGEKHLTVNYAKALVDKVSSYLMAGSSFAVDPLEDSDEAAKAARSAEMLLHQVHQDNALPGLDFDTEVDCAVLGDAAYKVTWDVKEKRVKVTSPDVQGLFAWWLPDDVSTVYRVASRYQLSADEVNLLYGHISKGKTAWLSEIWTDRTFEFWIDKDQVTSVKNPYGFIPYIIFPNLREPKKFWGISDIPVIMQSQRELNRAVSQLSRILELSGNPIAVIELLFRVLHDVSESPRAAWGGAERDLSGVALEIEMQPLLQKVRRKRLIRAAVYKKRNEMILALLEKFAKQSFGPVNNRIIWGPVLPRDFQRQVTNEVSLIQSGVHSRRSAMDQLGVEDPEREFQEWLEERKRILSMNKELNARSPRGEGEREIPPG